jgi:hypothetical protein
MNECIYTVLRTITVLLESGVCAITAHKSEVYASHRPIFLRSATALSQWLQSLPLLLLLTLSPFLPPPNRQSLGHRRRGSREILERIAFVHTPPCNREFFRDLQ